MARKPNEIISTANDRTQALEHMKAVELVPTSKTAASIPYQMKFKLSIL